MSPAGAGILGAAVHGLPGLPMLHDGSLAVVSTYESSARPDAPWTAGTGLTRAGTPEAWALLDAVPHNVCVVDTSGRIVHVNRSWVMFGRAQGLAMPRDGLGANYLELCRAGGSPRTVQTSRAVAAGLRTVLRSGHGRFSLGYHREEAGHGESFWQVTIVPAHPTGALVQHQDVTLQRQEERRRAVELAVADHAIQGDTGARSRMRLLTAVAGAAGWEAVLVWRRRRDAQLILASHWRADPRSKATEPPTSSRFAGLTPEGLVIAADQERCPSWVGPLDEADEGILASVFGPDHGLGSGFAVPFSVQGDPRMAVFYGTTGAIPDRELLELVAQVLSEDRSLRRPSVMIAPRRRPSDPPASGTIAVATAPGASLANEIERGAATDDPVLVQGEPGTHKADLARAIHGASRRKAGPLVVLDLSDPASPAGPAGLAAGARQAEGGTLVVEHVEVLDREGQDALAVVVAAQRGGDATAPRIVATASTDLRALVEQGGFRDDLYCGLNVVEIDVPPLRERPWDIPELVDQALAATDAAARGVRLDREAVRALRRHPWPGNQRELATVVSRIVAEHPDGSLVGESAVLSRLRRTGAGVARSVTGPELGNQPGSPEAGALRHLEQAHVQRVLFEVRFNMRKAAEVLGISRSTLYEKAHRYGIDLAAERARARATARQRRSRR